MYKKLLIIGGAMLLLVLTAGIIIYNWASTPYGWLDYKAAIGLKFYEEPDIERYAPQEIREQSAREDSWWQNDDKYKFEGRIKDTVIQSASHPLPVRIYTPDVQPEELPMLVYYHGGGFVFGSLDSYDRVCIQLARKIPAVVVSVDYRLAPEHPYPAARDDAYSALQWVYQHAAFLQGDNNRLVVCGDSAGGNLAAVVAQMARDKAGPTIAYQVLYYPATQAIDFNTASHHKYARGYGLSSQRVAWFTKQYLPKRSDRSEAYASPLLAEDFRNLPPALVVVAGFDPLRSEGEAYAWKLKAAGVPTQMVLYPGMIHGFVSVPFFDQSQEALEQTAQVLRKSFEK